ncbi:hypothetical protein CsSME_00001536 [Camellia sinensis var. sinensis]
MGENNTATTNQNHLTHHAMDISAGGSKCFDDDGRLKRTGTVWTASAHIITAVIGSGVLSLAWATAQLGWVAGPTVMFLFSFVTYYTSTLLAACYCSGDPDTGKRHYMDAVHGNLGGFQVKISWLSIVAAVMSFTYSSIGLGLGIGKVAEHRKFNGSGIWPTVLIQTSTWFFSAEVHHSGMMF